MPTVLEAQPAAEWNARFNGKDGWLGGDCVYSARLAPRRVLWLFGDTLLGTARDGGRKGAVMVNNTIGIQTTDREAAIRFVAGKTKDGKAAAFFTPADGRGWFWTQAAIRVGDRLLVFLPQIDKTKETGPLAFRQIGQWLAVVENPDDEPEKWRVQQHRVPFAEFAPERERSWGAALLEERGDLFIFGYTDERGKGLGRRQLTVARVPAGKADDFSAWRFYTSSGWSDRAEDAHPLAAGLATEFSVTAAPGGKGYIAVYTENGIGDRIVGRFADAPEGPWSAPLLLYRCPEMRKDRGVFCYAAKAHPQAATENELLLSYCVNAWEFARLFRDDEVYRPKFVRVKFKE